MEPEQTSPAPEETTQEDKFANLKKVTPLSKYLALTLFIALPFIGGWIGYTYAPEKVVEVEKLIEVERVEEVKSSLDGNDWTYYENTEIGFSFSYPSKWGDVELGEVQYSPNTIVGPRQAIKFSQCIRCGAPDIFVVSIDFAGIAGGKLANSYSGYQEESSGEYRVMEPGGTSLMVSAATHELSVINGALFYRWYDTSAEVTATWAIFNLNYDVYSGITFLITDSNKDKKNADLLEAIVETVVVEKGEEVSEPSPSNVFEHSSLKVGESYGTMVAEKITASSEDNVRAEFTGNTALTGTLSAPTGNPEDGGMGPEYSISRLSDSSISKLPRADTDDRTVWFGINNPEVVNEAGLKNRDEVEVVIDRYNYIHYPAGVWNTARIVSIKKIEQ